MTRRIIAGILIGAAAGAVPAETSPAAALTEPSPRCDPNPGRLTAQCTVADMPPGSHFNNVCHLTIHRKFLMFSSQSSGSAVVYQGKYLITAAHNIYQQRSRVTKIIVRCGVTNIAGRAQFFEEVTSDKFFEAAEGYSPVPLGSKDFGDDYGVIKLEKPVAGAINLPLIDGGAAAISVELAGYPGRDIAYADRLYSARTTANFGGDASAFLEYAINTAKGNSGGPVFALGAGGQVRAIAGIHVTNSTARAINKSSRDEIARLIKLIDARTP
jgi:V8-like Glu-specific endopeptidase